MWFLSPKVWPFKWKLLSSTFLWCCLLCCTRWFWLFESVDEILKCDHSNESYWAVLVAWPCLLLTVHCTRWFLVFSLWMKSLIKCGLPNEIAIKSFLLVLYKVIQTFESVDEILHTIFESIYEPFINKWKLLNSILLWYTVINLFIF